MSQQTVTAPGAPAPRKAALNTSGFVMADLPMDEDPWLNPVASPAPDQEPATAPAVKQYAERDDQTRTYGVVFRRDAVVSFGHHEAFRVNRHGVPVFTPGWTAARAAVRSWARVVLALLAAAAIAAGAAAMYHFEVGSSPLYNRLAQEGIETTAVVQQVDVGRTAAGLEAGIATATWEGEGKQGTVVFDETTNPLNSGSSWNIGDQVDLLVDPIDSGTWVLADSKPLPRFNVFTIAVLGIAALTLLATLNAAVMASKLTLLASRIRRGR